MEDFIGLGLMVREIIVSKSWLLSGYFSKNRLIGAYVSVNSNWVHPPRATSGD